ncbi:MAG: hypothetical protein JOZ69_05780 [Myxococcales bacterium]|nr:hypothetical protein [Myxococcales bacterium]
MFAVLFGAALASGAACRPDQPPRGPERDCFEACRSGSPRCGERACARGCNLILDRLLEREAASVLACVARSAPRCDDRTWAACAARVAIHADGGPPPPPPEEAPALD